VSAKKPPRCTAVSPEGQRCTKQPSHVWTRSKKNHRYGAKGRPWKGGLDGTPAEWARSPEWDGTAGGDATPVSPAERFPLSHNGRCPVTAKSCRTKTQNDRWLMQYRQKKTLWQPQLYGYKCPSCLAWHVTKSKPDDANS
jgi:hypothetical protein